MKKNTLRSKRQPSLQAKQRRERLRLLRERLRARRAAFPHAHLWLRGLLALGVVTVVTVAWAGWSMNQEIMEPDASLIALPIDEDKQALQEKVQSLVYGYPIERMASYIAQQDKVVAAYLVSIAKKESNWGKRTPHYQGRDCYNYWGYRDPDNALGTGGHTCFDTPKEAVRAVSGRIRELVYEEGRETPAKMIVWKCGYSCDGHSPESVQKWKQDVGYYFRKIIPAEK